MHSSKFRLKHIIIPLYWARSGVGDPETSIRRAPQSHLGVSERKDQLLRPPKLTVGPLHQHLGAQESIFWAPWPTIWPPERMIEPPGPWWEPTKSSMRPREQPLKDSVAKYSAFETKDLGSRSCLLG